MDFKKIDQHILEKRLWKAKEILLSWQSIYGFDPELYEKLGNVLLDMNDDIEAGKFLFFSGATNKKYQSAINLYLSRFEKNRMAGILTNVPPAIKKIEYSELPETVISTLTEENFNESLWPAKHKNQFGVINSDHSIVTSIDVIIVYVLLISIPLFALYGIYTFLKNLFL